jgi:acyl carrier protein
MDINEIEQRVAQVVADVACREADEIKPTTTLAEDLEMDEIDMDTLCDDLEDEFEIELDDESVSKARTVQDLIALVNTELNDVEADDDSEEDGSDVEDGGEGNKYDL